ncbi:type VI secretion system-associated protein TagF [uncultured Alsobacter sp.]|uniref:type VI secretion system-associated protein TagF n=1 Tax=uncultured Alsobacter sp. TaxID=1748258 RepID=UPI0025FEAEF6|nr:type VI secretion system-associated protein TagF [uncultured Alsobacter sp.]
MRLGLFGKLHAKRDFIAVSTPRAFLNCWEPWLQGAMSASRHALGDAWQPAFLEAPIWRFWLGPALCGVPVLGAMMPSIDGVGRYYPLTLIACDPDVPSGTPAIPPPEHNAQDAWFAEAEALLFDTLDPNRPFEHTTAALEALSHPETAPVLAGPLEPAYGGVVTAEGDPTQFDVGTSFAQLRAGAWPLQQAGLTCWWTAGGAGYPPRAATFAGMPDPYFLTGVLTGRFAGSS